MVEQLRKANIDGMWKWKGMQTRVELYETGQNHVSHRALRLPRMKQLGVGT